MMTATTKTTTTTTITTKTKVIIFITYRLVVFMIVTDNRDEPK